jgi:hypothetical protein
MTYGTLNVDSVVSSDGTTSGGLYGFKNRIINGAMMIDARNSGSSFTPVDSGYGLDRWKFYCTQASKFTAQQNAGSVTPPAGYKNYLGYTVSSAVSVGSGDYFVNTQSIEGYNVVDLAWGTASAAPITLSFWVRSSLTGTFSGSVINSTNNRSYVFTYAINSANTWEQKSITIAGDTTGTWLTTNGNGLELRMCLGVGAGGYSQAAGSWGTGNAVGVSTSVSVVGTAGATWYITGVQLEKGSAATNFDYRPYWAELSLCQRYYWRWTSVNQAYMYISSAGRSYSTTNGTIVIQHPVPMRTQAAMNNSNNWTAGNWDYSLSALSINNGGYAAFPYNFTNLNATGSYPGSDRSFTLGSGSSTTTTIWIEFTAEL